MSRYRTSRFFLDIVAVSEPILSTAESDEQELAALISRLADQVAHGEQLELAHVCRQHPKFAADLRELWGVVIVANMAGSNSSLIDTISLNAGQTPSHLDLPCEFGNYTLEYELGRGGMGIVYAARRHGDDQPVAIKMILKGDFASTADRDRFDSEALAASRLDHPHIIPIYEIGSHNGRAFFCMKLISGESLSERLGRGPLTSEIAAQIMSEISHAIEYAHQQGVLHRDLKPSNILLDESGHAYVADFGLAKYNHGQMSLTKSGAVIGTPAYMSPEQAAGARGQVGVLSDVYSLGAILYHTLTGRPPFLGTSPVDTVLMVIEQDPVAPRVINRQCNRYLEMITMRCLQKPMDLRYSSAGALANDLDAFLNDESISARFGRFSQIIGNVLRETHHAAVLENWGVLWMWHSLVLLVASIATEVFFWLNITSRWQYWLMWTVGMGAWAIVFWMIRHRMGPVTFIERQVAHVWASALIGVMLLFPLEMALNLPVLSLAPLLGALAGMTFLIKAGMLSGSFYLPAGVMFATSVLMAALPSIAMLLFGVNSAACFFLSGLKYYRRRINR